MQRWVSEKIYPQITQITQKQNQPRKGTKSTKAKSAVVNASLILWQVYLFVPSVPFCG
jgi:hypothetical protein